MEASDKLRNVLFRRDRRYVAVTSSRFGVAKLLYNHRLVHLAIWVVAVACYLGAMTPVAELNLAQTAFIIALIVGIAFLIHAGIVVIVVDSIKTGIFKTVLMEARLYELWRSELAKQLNSTKVPHAYEAFLVDHTHMWREAQDPNTSEDTRNYVVNRIIVFSLANEEE